MPLADYEIVFEKVPLPRGKSFEVRGLALTDVTELVNHHLADLTKAVNLYLARKKAGKWTNTALHEFAMIIARDLPQLTQEIIMLGCEEKDQYEKIGKLPVLVSINALLVICKLTTEEAGGLKNLSAFLPPLLQGVVEGIVGPGNLGTQTKQPSNLSADSTSASAETATS